MAYTQKSLLNTNRVKEQNENNIVRDISHLIGFTEDLETRIDGQNEFAELEDVNVTYTGNAGKVIAINATEDGVEAITISTANLYTSNGTLTANRTVTGAGFSLKFTGQSNFSIVSPSASVLDTAFSVRNNTDTANLLNIQGNGLFNLGTSTYADTQHVIRNTASFFYIHRVLDSSENILFNISRTEINLNIATGFNGGAETGTVAKFYGTVKTVSPSSSGLDTAFAIRNSSDTANFVQTVGSGTTIFRTDNAQQVDSIQAYSEGAFADKYPGLFINNCIAVGSKPALRAISQGAGANSENYGVFAIAQNGLAVNTGVRSQGYGAVGVLGIGVQGSTEAGWGAGGYFTAPSGNAEAFSIITTSKNLNKKFTNGTGLPAVNNLDGQFGAGVMAGVIVVESTTGLTMCISNGTNWIDIRTGVAVVI